MNAPAHKWLLTLLLLLLCGSAVEAVACSCIGEQPVCNAFGGSSAVFAGRVVGSAERKVYEDAERGTKTTYDVGTIYFAVEEAFSGVKGKTRVEIHSGTGEGDCGYWFLRGKSYLIYAHADQKGVLYTGICSRTRPLEEAAEDLTYLRRLPPEGTGARLYGMVGKSFEEGEAKVEERKIEGIAGIKITVTDSKGKRHELVTDAEGKYELSGLKPGEYEVKAELPAFYLQDYTKGKLKVFDRGCASANFGAIPNGQIVGRIVDAEGQPVKKAKISLLRVDASAPLSRGDEVGFDYVNDEQGKFQIGQVTPGEYLLGINVTGSPDKDSPYPPTFYPGVTSRSEAASIKVGLGEKLDDLVLRLPPRLVERTVQGVVVWPDGNPAAGAEVFLMDVNNPGYTTTGWGNKTDASGRFTLPGFDGVTYWVHANAPKHPGKDYHESGLTHAEPPRVKLTDNVFEIKLVLTSEGAVCKHYHKEGK